MFKFISNIPERLLYFISPPYCEFCKEFIKSRSIFCKKCYEKIEPVVSSSIQINENYILKVYSISEYKDPIKSLILSKIHKNILASKQIGQLMWQCMNLQNLEVDYFIPVPLHWTRMIKRGYNQAEVIASVLSEKKARPIANIVKRYKYTKYQSSLQHQLKYENVKNSFKLDVDDVEKYKNKNLIIVDDLLTSGSTIIAVAKELIKLKPKSISVVVACKVV